jgi:hypothetical protein
LILRKLSKEQLDFVIISKNKMVTTESVSKEIKEKWDIFIQPNEISKFWNFEYTDILPEEISKSKEYNEIRTKKRVYTNTKTDKFIESTKKASQMRRTYTEEQFWNILRDKKNCKENAKLIGMKYIGLNGLALSETTIQKIWNGKTKPINLDSTSIEEYNFLINYKRLKTK